MAAQLQPELWILIIQFLVIPNDDDLRAAKSRRIRLRCVEELAAGLAVQSSLRSLCLTSHYLQSIVTPFLYATPMTRHPLLFVRTLLDRPDLAELVKSLSHRLWSNWPENCPPYIDPRFARLLRDHDKRLMRYVDEERRRFQGAGSKMRPKETEEEEEEDEEIHWNLGVCDAVTLSLLPNLKDAGIVNAFMPVARSLMRNSLPNLSAIKIHFNWGELAQLPPRTLDWLTVVAPNIRSLTLLNIARTREGVRVPDHEFWGDRDDDANPDEAGADNDSALWGPCWPTPVSWFANVTHLCFRRCLIAPLRLSAMLRGFPALESLHFDIEPRDGDPFSTYILEAGLLEHAPRLRRLCVDISRFTLNNPYDNQAAMAWSPGLAGLTNLRLFKTSVKLLPRDPGGFSGGPCRRDSLVSIMPPNLEVLVIPEAGSTFGLVLTKALLGLLDAVRAGSFSSLRTICYGSDGNAPTDRGLLKVVQDLEEQGVRVGMKTEFSITCSEEGDNLDCLRHHGV